RAPPAPRPPSPPPPPEGPAGPPGKAPLDPPAEAQGPAHQAGALGLAVLFQPVRVDAAQRVVVRRRRQALAEAGLLVGTRGLGHGRPLPSRSSPTGRSASCRIVLG